MAMYGSLYAERDFLPLLVNSLYTSEKYVFGGHPYTVLRSLGMSQVWIR
jgi:hypothetical protein